MEKKDETNNMMKGFEQSTGMKVVKPQEPTKGFTEFAKDNKEKNKK